MKRFTDIDAYRMDTLHWHGIDPERREIHLSGAEEASQGDDEPGVEFIMANKFIRNIRHLDNASNEDIIVHMKTCGGFCEEGFAIYDAIKSCRSFVTIVNYTHARSMSSIILQAADHRVMMPNSYFMFHRGEMHMSGEATAMKNAVNFYYNHFDAAMLEAYADRMVSTKGGVYHLKPKAEVKEFLRSRMEKEVDAFCTARETVKLGLADKIFTSWADL